MQGPYLVIPLPNIEIKGFGRGSYQASALPHELHAGNLIEDNEGGRLVDVEEGSFQGVEVAVISLHSVTYKR